MKDKEYLEFVIEAEAPPAHLKEVCRKDIVLSFQGSTIVKKFIAYQVLGAIISLAFCPQFGMSFFGIGHHLTHHLHSIGHWACALYCGSLFLSSGMITALLSMKGEELWWILRRKKLVLIFMPAVFWGTLMLFNVSMKFPSESPSYHLIWVATAVFVEFLWLKFRTLMFRQQNV